MASSAETTRSVLEWVKATFPLASDRDLQPADSLLDSGIIDSLGTLEVVNYLESEFGLEVTDDEMVADHFDTVDSIVRLIHSKSRSDGYEQVS